MSAQQWHLVCVCVCLRVHAHACARTCVCNLQRVFSYRDDSDFILAASEAAEATTPVPGNEVAPEPAASEGWGGSGCRQCSRPGGLKTQQVVCALGRVRGRAVYILLFHGLALLQVFS